jgi:hypothetical protein
MECIVKVRLVVIVAIAIFGYSVHSVAHTQVRSQEQTDSAVPASRHVREALDSRPSRDNETVIVDLSLSSLEIDPSFAEYLNLSSRQIRAIQRLMSQERREIDPLKAQLQRTHRKLLAAADQGQSKKSEILAATEARILTKLIIKNSRSQARLHGLLTHEQQKKLEDLEVQLNER